MLHIGFDVGGTKIAVGAVDDNDMRIVARRSVSFPTGESYQKIIALMASLIKDLANELAVDAASFRSIGIAVPGSIDSSCERVLHAHNLQLHDAPLKAEMKTHFPTVPVFLANDANAAALAELHAGAFRGVKTAVLMTLGTGIGGGIILGGKMFNGGLGNGVELGHMVLAHGGPICTCGMHGCIEAICTATWLVQQGRRSIIDYPKALIYTQADGDLKKVTAKLVIDCAKAGDAIAKDIFEQYVDQLGSAITSCIHILDPEIIALGGGVIGAGDFLFHPVYENVRKKCFYEKYASIVPAQLGNDAGIIGAAMLFRNETCAV